MPIVYDKDDGKCALCQSIAKMAHFPGARTSRSVAYGYSCKQCGEFAIGSTDREHHLENRSRVNYDVYKFQALFRERALQGLPPYYLTYEVDQSPSLPENSYSPIRTNELLAQWPQSVQEVLDRSLLNIARLSTRREWDNLLPEPGKRLTIEGDCPLFFAQNGTEAIWAIDAFTQQGFLTRPSISRSGDIIARSSETFELTPSGWERVRELERGRSSPENSVFIAMWFGDEERRSEMAKLFSDAIRPAVKTAGYKNAERVDTISHNEYIMNKVLAKIRLSPFIIADFTHNSPGVYYEAGFARGLGLQVVHSCKESDFAKVHFDMKQMPFIRWKTVEELRTELAYHILGSLGPGPYLPKNGASDV